MGATLLSNIDTEFQRNLNAAETGTLEETSEIVARYGRARVLAYGAALQDYMARTYGRWIPVGYKMIDFVQGPGIGPSNPKASFGSSQLTAARKYELDGDITTAANR